jgi:WD40 repeat protein
MPVRGLAISAGKDQLRVISVSEDRTLVAWEPYGREKPKVVWHRDSPLRCVALAPSGGVAATGSGDVGPRAVQVIRLWDLAKLEPLPTEMTCRAQVNAVAFAPDGKWLVSAENDGGLALWDVRTGTAEWEEAKTHGGLGAFDVAISPTGKQIATCGGDGRVVLRDLATGKALRTFEGHAKAVRAIAFLPDGRRVVSAGLDAAIRVSDLAGGPARSWTAPAPIQAMAVSPGGKRVLTGDAAGGIRLWDTETGETIIHFSGHEKQVTAVAFTSDGKSAVSGGSDGTVRFWDLPSPKN